MITIPLPLLNSAPDMAVLDLESKESLVKECGSLDFVNLRGTPKQISSVRWNKDSWHKFLFGRICLPSLTESFEDWWIWQLRESLVNRTQQPENAPEDQTNDSFSTTGCEDLKKCNQTQSSSKTWRDYLAAECQMDLFASNGLSKNWNIWITELRLDYSVRANVVRLTKESGFSYWPTPTAHLAKEICSPSEKFRNTPSLATQVRGEESGKYLNPEFVEWLMGVKTGWTDCDFAETE